MQFRVVRPCSNQLTRAATFCSNLQWTGGGNGEDDDDDVSPRTLQAAAARLAKYTSEEEGGGPSDQWADFFR